MRAEPRGAELPLAVEERHRPRIDRAAKRLLRNGDGSAAHADRLHSVAVGEIPVGGVGGPGNHSGGRERGAEGGKLSSCHDFSLWVVEIRCTWLERNGGQMKRLTSAYFAIGRNVAAPTYS